MYTILHFIKVCIVFYFISNIMVNAMNIINYVYYNMNLINDLYSLQSMTKHLFSVEKIFVN